MKVTEQYHKAENNGMYLYSTCASVKDEEYNNFFKGTKTVSGAKIRKLIEKHIPELYNALGLNFRNPFERQSRVKDNLFIYVHSAVDYFIIIN